MNGVLVVAAVGLAAVVGALVAVLVKSYEDQPSTEPSVTPPSAGGRGRTPT